MKKLIVFCTFLAFIFAIGCGPDNRSNEEEKNDSADTPDKNQEDSDGDAQSHQERADTDIDSEDPAENKLLCNYDHLTGYEAGDIMVSFDSCQPLTCKNGEFVGLDDNFCDGCRYWNDPEKEGELREMMKLSCNSGEVEIDWCECVTSDSPSGKKWFCGYAYGCQCIYQGKKYDLGYEIATDFCKTSTCARGTFDFTEDESCPSCYYYDKSENTTKQAAVGDKQDFTCPDGSKVDWCECIADDLLGQKWKCTDRVDLNCPGK